jgi:hypothetical protein
MTRRKGEITRDDLKPIWPHHVALPPEKVRLGDTSRDVIEQAAIARSCCLTLQLTSNSKQPVWVKNGHRGRSTGTSPVPQMADDFDRRASRQRCAMSERGLSVSAPGSP